LLSFKIFVTETVTFDPMYLEEVERYRIDNSTL